MPVDIAPSFEVLARGSAPSPVAMDEAAAIGVSSSYLAVVADGADLELEHESGIDVRIWSPQFVAEMNVAIEVERWLPGCVAIGDADGLLLVESGSGLMAFGAGALDFGEARRVAVDLIALLAGELGDLR